MTSRAKFDMVLSRKAADAGAEVKQEILVQNLAVHHSFVEVHTRQEQFQSRMIIGCDGMGGPTARATGLYGRWAPKEVSYAIESEVPLGEDEVRRFMGAEKYFDVYFGVSPAGYGWIFPKDDHLTVGVGCRLSDLRDAHKIFNDFLNEIPELNGRAIPSPRAHLIPLGGAANVHTVTNRVLLAGDSAGFAEPFLGEGIYFAILGGQIAAEVAREACQKESFDSEFLSMYEERCESAFGIDFDAALRLARLSYLENYDMDRVARIFFPDRRFHECVIELMEGSMRYRDVPAKLAWLYFKYRLSKLGLPVGT
jgi:flavin-dependent dehydrogenase